MAHGGEVVGESFGLSGLQLLDEELDVSGDEFLLRVGLLTVEGGIGLGGHVGFSLGVLWRWAYAGRGWCFASCQSSTGLMWVVVRSRNSSPRSSTGTCPRTSPQVEQETVTVLPQKPKLARST